MAYMGLEPVSIFTKFPSKKINKILIACLCGQCGEYIHLSNDFLSKKKRRAQSLPASSLSVIKSNKPFYIKQFCFPKAYIRTT